VPTLKQYVLDFNEDLGRVMNELLSLFRKCGVEALSFDFAGTTLYREFGYYLLIDPKATLRQLASFVLKSGELSFIEILRHFPSVGTFTVRNKFANSAMGLGIEDYPEEELLFSVVFRRLMLDELDSDPGFLELVHWIREFCASSGFTPFLTHIDEFIATLNKKKNKRQY